MSPREKPAYDVAILASDPDLDELMLLLLGEMEYRAIASAPENLPAARIFIVNLDHAPSAEAAGGLRGSVIIGISGRGEPPPEQLSIECLAILRRPVGFEDFRNTVRKTMSEAGKLLLFAEDKPQVRQFELDIPSRCISSGNISVRLTPNELILLSRLIELRGEAVERQELSRLIGAGASNKTEVYISNIRRKLESAFGDKLIYTVRGVGYMIKK
ncbi:MAG: winged helix-turn-helix domain-containing protein [Eubacteriales bacterium]|jgi:DNA-binding response OmpR family regulator